MGNWIRKIGIIPEYTVIFFIFFFILVRSTCTMLVVEIKRPQTKE